MVGYVLLPLKFGQCPQAIIHLDSDGFANHYLRVGFKYSLMIVHGFSKLFSIFFCCINSITHL